MKIILSWVAGLIGLIALSWLLSGNYLAMRSVFAPAHEQVRRDVFEQSKAYRDAAVQELRSMQFAYLKADPVHRAGLASVMRHKAAGLPVDAIPYDLALFLKELP